MQADTKCAICLDYMREPATIECGHNFCQPCLQQYWHEDLDKFTCPVCRHTCQQRHWTANSQLARIIEITQLLPSRSEEVQQQETRLCERHNQVLSLFCEEDLEVLCPGCVQPPDHQHHHVRSMEEAASHYRQMINVHTSTLISCSEFQQDTDRQIKNLQKKKDWLSKQRLKFINELVSERTVKADLHMLTGVGKVYGRCESVEIPTVCSVDLKREGWSLPPLNSDLQVIRHIFREDVTLDPHTAHPHLHVSKNKRSVTYMEESRNVLQRQQKIPLVLEVLGSEEFCVGRHYWEVQVEDKPSWAIGMCIHSPSGRLQQLPLFQNRCWTIQLQDGDYVARGAKLVPLALKTKPRGIGVYLDYELGQISFYNLNDSSHIHSFRETLSHPLKPYFCLGKDSKPLSICAQDGYEG
ncbi:tripartite motif-containing protein 75-like [Erinaceus europaeus]|uniref:Tripartite motif-containing protein 75-like n=1 Tax=Erinaceus europaeus TaxID=9365 RepID=A0ABM3WF51_ERIEU|nr:tripartite motif-containing protein 75-like [Erinaceus europaeus]